MGAILLRLRTWWETADKTARIVTIFGSLFLVLLLGGTFYFASKPKMSLVYGGLSPAEVGKIVPEIQKLGVQVDSDLAGNIFVPSNKLAEVQHTIAGKGIAPSSAHLGDDDLAKLNSMSTPAVEKERIKAIAEGNIATSIEQMEGIGSARVHITLGERTAFASEQKPSTAAVFLQEKQGGYVGSDMARGIAMLTSRSVPGLSLENVFVTDNTGRSLFDGSNENTSGSQASEKIAAETMEAQRRERDLQGSLDAICGMGNTLVKVNLSMDFDQENIHSHIEKSDKNPLASDTATETIGGGKAPATGGTAGVGDNSPAANPPGSNNDSKGDYKGDKAYTVYPKTTIEKTTEKAVGSITTMSISVMANKGKADTAAVQSFLDTYIKANPGATAQVTEATFDTTAADEAKKAAGSVSSQNQMQQMFSLLPVLALVVVAFLVFKGLAKAAKNSNVLVTALPGGGYMTAGTGSSEFGKLGNAGPGSSTSMPALESNPNPGSISLTEYDDDTPEIRAIRQRLNVPLEQIKRMAQDKPEAVAMVIKSWLLEERR